MISKDTFVKVMTKLEELDKKMENVDVAITALCPDYCRFYISDAVGIPFDILEDIFNDKDGWISYFVFELNWLHNYYLGAVNVDGKDVDLSSWDKVYDFLIKNME